MRIEVLPSDIREADEHFREHPCPSGILLPMEIGRSMNCPVARAVKREAGTSNVSVSPTAVHIWQEGCYIGQAKVLLLPEVVTSIIRMYDARGDMDPFGFEL